MGSGLIISASEPKLENLYTWMKPLPDGGKEWYEIQNGAWAKVKTEPAPALADHIHAALGDINFTGTVSVNGDAGITGSRLILGVGTLTFKKGILTGFTPA